MKTKPWIGFAAFVLAASALGTMWRAMLAADAAEAQRAALGAERASADAALRQLQAKIDAQEMERQKTEAALAALRASAGAPGKGKDAGPAVKPSNIDIPGAIQRDPKLQVLELASRRAEFEGRYGPFLLAQNLTPAQIAKLSDARIRGIEQAGDIRAIMEERHLPTTDPAIQELRQRAMEEQRAQQVAALGEDGYAKLLDYERTLSARSIVNRLAGAAALGDVPLTAEQAERMTAILVAASGSPGRDGVQLSRIDWAAVDAQASGVLSAPQLALFQRTEPIGGGNSRWSAQLDKATAEARTALGQPGGGGGK